MRTPTTLLAGLALLAACPSSDEPWTGTARITVSDPGGSLQPGVDVVFHAPDGSVVAHVQTDGSGSASATIEAGALVTVARSYSGIWDLVTVAGLEPGDALVLAPFPSIYYGGTVVGSASVTYPGALEGADQYSVILGCNSSDWQYTPDPQTVQLISWCGDAVDAVGIASSAADGTIGWATALGVPVTGTAPDRSATIALGAWRTALAALRLTLDDPPADAAGVYASLTPRRNGFLWYSTANAQSQTLAPPASASVAIPFAGDLFTSGRLEVRLDYAWSGSGLDAGLLLSNETSLADRAIDLAAEFLPRVSAMTLVEGATGWEASWTVAARDPRIDATFLGVTWGEISEQRRWSVLLPPGRTRFRFPALPDALAEFLPLEASPVLGKGVTDWDLSTVPSYREFRASQLAFLLGSLPEQGDWTLRSSSTMQFE